MNLSAYSKAIAPLVVTAVIAGIAKFGVNPDMSVQDLLTLAVNGIIASAAVYQVRNKI